MAHRDPQWTVKGMPVAERKAAAQAALRQDRSHGEWLAIAIRTQLMLEAGELAPAGRAGEPGIPAGIPSGIPGIPTGTLADLEQLARVCSLVAQAAGKPVPRSVTRLMWRQVRERLGGDPGPAPGAGMPKSLPGMPDGHPGAGPGQPSLSPAGSISASTSSGNAA